jgi:cytochrome bd-type quinol oxidase subunit 2
MPELAACLAVLFTALALIPGGAHLLELANKMRLDQRDYFVAQSLYRGWQFVGFLVVAALAANIWAATAHEGAAFWWFAIAAALIVLSLVVFFVWTFPSTRRRACGPDNLTIGESSARGGSIHTR